MASHRLERKQKLREHHLGMMAHVEAVFELAKVFRQVLAGDVDVCAPDAVLKP